MKIRATVIVRGLVQGVAFRHYTSLAAERHRVTGWVKNLPDGRVEVVAQGDETDAFIEAIRQSVLAGHIENERLETIPRVEGLRGFLIIP